jgi:hypothetical protein
MESKMPASDRRSSLFGISCCALAAICLVGGSTSLIDAADGWQDVLNTIHEWRKPNPQCPGPWTVLGWGDGAVLILSGMALCLLGGTLLATLHSDRRGGRRGQSTALLAVIPVFLLWIDSFAVGGAPTGDCDSVGLGGAASSAILRAGWFFFATIVLCLLTANWLGWRGENFTGPWGEDDIK